MADNRAGIWVLLVLAIALSPVLFLLPETTRVDFWFLAVFGPFYALLAIIPIIYYQEFRLPRIPHAILMGLLGLNFGLALGWLALIIGIALHIGYFWLWVSIGLSVCAFAYGTFLAFKRWKNVFLAAASLYLTAGLLVTGLAAYQQHVVDSYAKLWKSKGWPMEARDLFPLPSTRTECQKWLDTAGKIKEESLSDCIYSMQDEFLKISECFSTGEQVKGVLSRIASRADIPWEYLDESINNFTAAMENCPYLQRYSADEIEKRNWDEITTRSLDLVKWARFIYWRSVLFQHQGRHEESLRGLEVILDMNRQLIRGEDCHISRLVAAAIERQAILGYAAALAIEQHSFSEALRIQIRKRTEGDFIWLIRTLHETRLSQWHHYDRPYLQSSLIWIITIWDPQAWWLLGLHRYAPIVGMYYLKETIERLNDYTSWTEWAITLPDLNKGHFPLTEYRRKWPDNGWMGGFMERNLSLIAQWRIVLMMDAVIEYYQTHGGLPEKLQELSIPILVDPFDQKQLRYRKETETRFVVYSIGPDLKDGYAKDLFVDGSLNANEANDVGFRITLND